MRLSPITVDDRQKTPPANTRAKELQDRGAPATVDRLDLGDYQWVVFGDEPQVVVVEEKLPDDLFASVEDDRLGRFVREEVAENTTKALLVVGAKDYNYADAHVSGNGREWSVGQIDNLLVSVQLSGVVVLRTATPFTAATRLVDFWEYTGKDEHNTLNRVIRPEVSQSYMDTDKREAVRMLMCLPGIGEKKAVEILKGYSSVSLALEFVADWPKNVTGIGPGLATRAGAFLDREIT